MTGFDDPNYLPCPPGRPRGDEGKETGNPRRLVEGSPGLHRDGFTIFVFTNLRCGLQQTLLATRFGIRQGTGPEEQVPCTGGITDDWSPIYDDEMVDWSLPLLVVSRGPPHAPIRTRA